MKAVGGRLKPWGPAFSALLDGKIDFVMTSGENALSRRILIDRESIETVRSLAFDERDLAYRKLSYSPVMSKIDAGEVLNLGFSRSIPLLSAIRTKTGTHQHLVPVDYVKRLAVSHMSSTELALRRGVTPQRAYRDATRDGVLNLGPGGFCRELSERKYFPSREDDHAEIDHAGRSSNSPPQAPVNRSSIASARLRAT